MTQTFTVWLEPQCEWLVERWLHTERPQAPVVLLTGKEALPAANRLAAGPYGQRIRVQELAAPGGETPPRVILPVPLDVEPMTYRFPVRLPCMLPWYPLIRRLWLAGCREFEFWNLTGSRTVRVPHLLDEFKNRHQGQRCFVAGNGPSLNAIDMTRLKNEITFGANRCYLGFEKWGFPFTYWGVSDVLQIEEYGAEYERHVPEPLVKFYPFQYLPYLDFKEACPALLDWPRAANREFSINPERLATGYTVTYMLLQIAALMGCDPIILIGVDHRYDLRRHYPIRRLVRLAGRWVARRYDGHTFYKAIRAANMEVFKSRRAAGSWQPSRLWEAKDAAHPTHFDDRYAQGAEKRFLMPRPHEAEQDFDCAAQWAEEHHVRILNATPGSALTAFPAADFDHLF